MTANNCIRPMRAEDAAAVAQLEQQNFATPWSEQDLRHHIELYENSFFVFEKDARVIGYIGLMISYETADIITLCVAGEYRRNKIGEKLLLNSIEICQNLGVQKLFLEVRQHNTAAQGLYQNNGFSQISVRKNYYHNPTEDAIVMAREL